MCILLYLPVKCKYLLRTSLSAIIKNISAARGRRGSEKKRRDCFMAVTNYEVRQIDDLRHMLQTSVALFGEKNAFLWKGASKEYRPITYNTYKEEVEALGTALWDMGYAGKRIAVTGENGYPWALSYMTVVCGLGVVVPVDKEINTEDFTNIINISEVSLVLYAKATEEKVEGLPNTDKLCFDELPALIEKGKKLLSEGKREYLDAVIDREGLASLIFTSGTTGVSKGVMLSHHNICFNLMGMCQMIYIDETDTFLSVLPLHHVYECTCGFLCQIYRGCTIAYCEGLRHITKNMQESGTTKVCAVPLLVESMYKRIWQSAEKSGRAATLRKGIKINNFLKKFHIDLSKKLFKEIHQTFGGKLKLMIAGGAAIDPAILSGLRDIGILAVQGYGLSECAPIAAVNRDTFYNDSAAGLCPPHCQLEIVNMKDDGTGEIRFKGENVMLGYYNAPDLTEEVIQDGWFYTGDLGFIDEQGFLHITGRKKNVIVTANGKNIFPEELETYLARNPLVLESVIVGMMNERRKDYDIIAIIVPNMERFQEEFGENVTPALVKEKLEKAVAEVNKQVQNYKHIDITMVRETEFEKNTSKKIKRYGIEDSIAEAYKALQKR